MLALIAPLVTLTYAGTASAEAGHHDRHDNGHGVSTIYTETNAAAATKCWPFRISTAHSPRSAASQPAASARAPVSARGRGRFGRPSPAGRQCGSNQVSLFGIERDGTLSLGDVESSHGMNPVSIALNDDIAYVVNAGDSTISGFRIRHDRLEQIDGSTQSLSGIGAAQISFDATGKRLVVTEKATSTIDVFAVNRHGVASAAVAEASAGKRPSVSQSTIATT